MKKERFHSGFVIRIKGAYYHVVSGRAEIPCVLRGKFRLDGHPEEVLPVVGDNVDFRMEGASASSGRTGMIVSVGERRSIFARSVSGGRRKKILGANLDYVFLIHSVKRPDLNLRLLDRMIVSAEHGNIKPVICVNKIDLAGDREGLGEKMEPYREMGYPVYFCSAFTGAGIDSLSELMKDRKSLMAGPSGSGKTSIIARLEPDLEFRIGKVSEKSGKGRHTTTHFELHPLTSGGYLGDTPGIREFGIELVDKDSLQYFFRDFADYLGECRFSTCLHYREPECAVKLAVEKGEISEARYESYVKMLEDLGVK